MPFGYLVTVALFGLATLLALVPPRHPRPLARAGFLVGGVFNEIPLHASLFLLAATALAFAEGNINSPVAWIAVSLALLTICGLGVVAWRGLQAAPVIEQAMRDGLGPDWRSTIRSGRPSRRAGVSRWARIVLTPWFVWRSDVSRQKDIPYGDAGRRNLLDVYGHRSRPTGRPVLVYLHGGGYFSGGKNREAKPLLRRLAHRGWTCVSTNYRLRPAASFPDHLIDAKRAIAWARENARELGGDPAQIFVAGSSAGGHLAAFAALTANDPSFQPGFEHLDTSVSAAICLYGYLGNYYGQSPDSSPGEHAHAGAPPFFIAQGDQDTYSPRFLAIARDFVEELRGATSAPVVYAELPGGQHAFDVFSSPRFEAVVDGVEEFTRWVRSQPEQAAAKVKIG
jgi:acetyl esterase/lipase